MHVECSACGAGYTIADEKIPHQGARVRCRKCSTVFAISRSPAPPTPVRIPVIPPTPERVATSAPAPSPAPSHEPALAPSHAPIDRSFGFEHAPSRAESAPGAAPAATQSAGFAQAPERLNQETFERESFFARKPEAQGSGLQAAPPPPAGTSPAPPPPVAPSPVPSPATGIPEGLSDTERVRHERARRLARVLASDIAIYNKDKRDHGIRDGNLVAVLGYEIKKSWEVYKERVTPELANSTPYFRDALNEIVADGKKIF